MNARITQADQHRRNNDAVEGAALSRRADQLEANARRWGQMAAQSIKAGKYQEAINRLQQALDTTSHSQYTGFDFNN